MAPFALTLVAAAFERYPYGGSTRVSLFLAPIICVLAGLGAARLLAAFRRERLRRCGLASVVLVLATIGAAIMSWDLTHPYKTTYDRDLREFAREFWTEQAADAELVCAWTDMKQDLFPRKYSWRSMAQYLSNQRIYSARHCQGGHAPHVQAISAEHPLRCVVYSLPDVGGNEGALSEWLAGMQSRFELTRVERHDFSKNHEHGPPDRERIEVYEFVPPGSPAEEPRLEPPQSLSKSRPRAASR